MKTIQFQIEDEYYNKLQEIYKTFIIKICNDTFEDFCKNMCTKGVVRYLKDIERETGIKIFW